MATHFLVSLVPGQPCRLHVSVSFMPLSHTCLCLIHGSLSSPSHMPPPLAHGLLPGTGPVFSLDPVPFLSVSSNPSQTLFWHLSLASTVIISACLFPCFLSPLP